jgi:hypothetical protein
VFRGVNSFRVFWRGHAAFRMAQPSDDSHGELFAALYAELRHIAQRELKRSGGELASSATTLLHEAGYSRPNALFIVELSSGLIPDGSRRHLSA